MLNGSNWHVSSVTILSVNQRKTCYGDLYLDIMSTPKGLNNLIHIVNGHDILNIMLEMST